MTEYQEQQAALWKLAEQELTKEVAEAFERFKDRVGYPFVGEQIVVRTRPTLEVGKSMEWMVAEVKTTRMV
jgi:hypothetical protein